MKKQRKSEENKGNMSELWFNVKYNSTNTTGF